MNSTQKWQATPPGDVAMQAAREIGTTSGVTLHLLNNDASQSNVVERVAAIIQRAITEAQAPTVCQSDEDVAQMLADHLQTVSQMCDAYQPQKLKAVATVIARHRQDHENTAWQKGCEYMREAAAGLVKTHADEDPQPDSIYPTLLRDEIVTEIRALPIPPAPTGGQK